jgi:hypothetical protein
VIDEIAALGRHEVRIAAECKTPKMHSLGIMKKGARKQMRISSPSVWDIMSVEGAGVRCRQKKTPGSRSLKITRTGQLLTPGRYNR